MHGRSFFAGQLFNIAKLLPEDSLNNFPVNLFNPVSHKIKEMQAVKAAKQISHRIFVRKAVTANRSKVSPADIGIFYLPENSAYISWADFGPVGGDGLSYKDT